MNVRINESKQVSYNEAATIKGYQTVINDDGNSSKK